MYYVAPGLNELTLPVRLFWKKNVDINAFLYENQTQFGTKMLSGESISLEEYHIHVNVCDLLTFHHIFPDLLAS